MDNKTIIIKKERTDIMNKKSLFIILFLIIIGLIIYFIFNHISITNNTDDSYLNYTPQEEISEEQTRETTITLYYLNKENNQIKSQGKIVNISDLAKNPYKLIVNKLIEGPTDESLKSVFPENTRLIDASLINNCVILNFSEDLLNFKDETEKFNIINCLLNSLTQLNEVNSIKILINNKPTEKMDQEYSSISENP